MIPLTYILSKLRRLSPHLRLPLLTWLLSIFQLQTVCSVSSNLYWPKVGRIEKWLKWRGRILIHFSSNFKSIRYSEMKWFSPENDRWTRFGGSDRTKVLDLDLRPLGFVKFYHEGRFWPLCLTLWTKSYCDALEEFSNLPRKARFLWRPCLPKLRWQASGPKPNKAFGISRKKKK